jgi:hypothetical protein
MPMTAHERIELQRRVRDLDQQLVAAQRDVSGATLAEKAAQDAWSVTRILLRSRPSPDEERG